MSEPTPRPWPIAAKSVAWGEYPGKVAYLYSHDEWEEMERRWNAHEALVEALRKAGDLLDTFVDLEDISPAGQSMARDVANACYDALRLAGATE